MKKENMNTKIASFSAWAYAFGCAVGWGAFMMPGDIFLPKAGPLGALIGVLIASLIMFFVGQSTFYMAKTYPEDAGVHVYISRILGYDHGFLSAWSILLAYISVLWSNSTAIIILIRSVWGSVLQFGFHYKIAGYDVYFGEILLSAIIIVFFAVIAIIGKKFVRVLHIILALVHIIFVIVLFIGVFAGGRHSDTFGFANVDVSEPLQVFNIVMLAPWMYVGFEAFMYMFNSGGRKPHNADKVTVISIITIAAAYILPMLIPVFGLPDGYSSWDAFIAASSSETVSGLFASPVFYSTYYVLGKKGLYLLLVCILCAISTSIFGSYRALGRLLTSMSEEKLMPKCVGKKYKNGEPIVGILIVMAVSLIIPLTGRTALGWMIDITTITATIVYVYSMISVLKLIKNDPNSKPGFKVVPILGMVLAGTSFLFLLIPNILSETKIATESYLILFIWSILGVAYYMYVYRKDKENKYGQTPIMWIFMSFIIMFSSVMWIRQRNVDEISEGQRSTESLIELIGKNSLIQMIVVILVLVALYSLFNILFKRQKEADKKAIEMESKSEAKTAFLFNMSHDIRTPMNAILGFTDLALIDPADEEKVRDYLGKIKSSSNHLLTLINDMLEMSRIESGKVEINELPEDLEQIFSNIESILRGQAEAKNLIFVVDVSGVKHRYVYVDRLRLNQVIINLVSNAIKYTPDGGKVEVIIKETDYKDSKATYDIKVRDNGLGMSEEFAAKIFESFERENREEIRSIQGTGIGMAITKNIVDMFEGEITLDTKINEGSTFDVTVAFREASEEDIYDMTHKTDISEVDFDGMRVLLADDMEINREIAVAILELYGFDVVTAVDGKDALTKVVTHPPGYFKLVFMDIQMPKLNGYEASMAIRNISDRRKASVPIIAMTANAFESDIKDAKDAGMNGHVAKPIDQEKLVEEIKKVLSQD